MPGALLNTKSTDETRLILNEELYEQFILTEIPKARNYIWIATADIKNMHVKQGRRFVPFLKILSDALERGIEIRLLHAKEPGKNFRADFDRFEPLLSERFERILCPRVHMKCLILDGSLAYTGSANLTGAAMGARSVKSRNFEAGIISSEKKIIVPLMNAFDKIFMGSHCGTCKFRRVCPDPII